MPQTTPYPYSLNFSLATILLMLLFMMLIFSNVGSANGLVQMVMYGVCSFIFLCFLALLVVKRLIPALKGDVALAADEEGISDYIREISINWVDIKQISLIRGRSASIIQLDLKWDSDYGKQINIPLRWVKGKDAEIYETVMSYFKRDTQSPTD
jgi:hypothetical protein